MAPRSNARCWALLSIALVGCSEADVELEPPSEPDPVVETCASALGLYADTGCDALAEGVLAFSPQFPLWSDAVSKERFVYIPPGETVDVSDPDAWVFPLGTKFWKHFQTEGGMRLETRIIEKTAELKGEPGWSFETYAWNEAGDDVTRIIEGQRDVLGTAHDIPEEDDCSECHSGGENQFDAKLGQDQLLDLALGFGAIQLNHEGSDTTLESLAADGRLAGDVSVNDAVIPGDATAKAALGYLHANCGSCHGGGRPSKDLTMFIPVGTSTVEATPTYRGTVNEATDPGERSEGLENMPMTRIVPGDPDNSALVWRMLQRTNDDAPCPRSPPTWWTKTGWPRWSPGSNPCDDAEAWSLTTPTTKTKSMFIVRCITFFAGLLMLAGCGGCGRERFEPEPYDLDFDIPRTEAFAPTLSTYGLYQEPLASLQPADGVHLYELSSELFSDYAFKQRLIRVPEGSTATLEADGSLIYPEGTVMVKTFYYPSDMREPDGDKRIIETRLLVKTSGRWNVATYLWNAEQTEATKLLTGTTTDVSWIDEAGQPRSTNYAVPQEGECVTCHQTDESSTYIGPTPRNLNRMVERDTNQVNQLAHLATQGVVAALDESPTIPNYKDTTESLENRARAYLDINCAHCHQPQAWSDASRRPYDFRYATALADTGLMGEGNQVSRQLTEGEMPYLGTTLRHDEGIQIVLDYIDENGLGDGQR